VPFPERSVADTEGNILEIAMATKVRSAFPLEGQEGGESKMAGTCVSSLRARHGTLRVCGHA